MSFHFLVGITFYLIYNYSYISYIHPFDAWVLRCIPPWLLRQGRVRGHRHVVHGRVGHRSRGWPRRRPCRRGGRVCIGPQGGSKRMSGWESWWKLETLENQWWSIRLETSLGCQTCGSIVDHQISCSFQLESSACFHIHLLFVLSFTILTRFTGLSCICKSDVSQKRGYICVQLQDVGFKRSCCEVALRMLKELRTRCKGWDRGGLMVHWFVALEKQYVWLSIWGALHARYHLSSLPSRS